MKYLMILLFSFSQIALGAEYDSEFTRSIFADANPNDCVSASSAAHLVVVRKIAPGKYETASLVNTSMYDQEIASHSLLSTNGQDFDGPGEAVFMKVRYKGVKLVKLENGFDAKYGVWEQCK